MANNGKRKLKKEVKVAFAAVFVLALIGIALLLISALHLFSHGTADKDSQISSAPSASTSNPQNEVTDAPSAGNNVSPSESDTHSAGNNTNPSESNAHSSETSSPAPEPSEDELHISGLFNTFGGYTSAIIANGGLITQPGSYYYKSGLDVSIGIEDDDDVIIQSFIDGYIDFFFMTVNKMPIVCKQLSDNGIDVIIPYFCDTSTGGDGIVAKTTFSSMESLQNAKIAMASNSVSTAIPLWFLNQTDLDSHTISTIVNNFQMYESTQEAVEAFASGEADAVSTWDMTGALSASNSHLLFSTANAENLVIDALVINKDFATKHPEAVTALIDGCISVVNDSYTGSNTKNYDIIRDSVPDYADYDDETMADVIADSRWLSYSRNVDIFKIAPGIYKDFADVWDQLGESTDHAYVDVLFDDSYIQSLSNKWTHDGQGNSNTITADQDSLVDRDALISKTASIEFAANEGDRFKPGFEEQNYAILDDFIETAKILNRMVISVEGNVSLDLRTGEKSTAFDYSLSLQRAEYVKDYMVAHGIEANRIVTVGNGGDKPIVDVSDPDFRAKNRYVLLSIYTGESD